MDGDPVVQVFHRFGDDLVRVHVGQARAGSANQVLKASHVQRSLAAVFHGDRHVHLVGGGGEVVAVFGGAFGGLLFAVQHIVTGHFLLAVAHQGQFYLVLNFLDVDGATGGHAALEGGGDLFGQACHGFMDAGRCSGGAAFDSEKGLADGDGNLVVIVAHYLAITLDYAQLPGGGVGKALILIVAVAGRGAGVLWVLAHIRLHGALSVVGAVLSVLCVVGAVASPRKTPRPQGHGVLNRVVDGAWWYRERANHNILCLIHDVYLSPSCRKKAKSLMRLHFFTL